MFKMLTYSITSKFGQVDNFHPQPHTGVDIATPAGTPAQSITDGIVSKVANDPMLGNSVSVNGVDGKEWVYGHLSKINVAPGQRIDAGDILGLTGGVPGTPGAGHSTGAHIHISALANGQIVDPTPAITGQPDGGFLSKLWHALVTPGVDLAKESIWVRIVDSIDPLFTIITIVLILLSMMGSHRSHKAKRGVFWSVSLYILLKLIITSL